jgi:REP element-mobilizing transposase RayT
MPRPHRIEFPGAFYHVYARGNNKQKIFMDTQDYTVYLDRIKRYYNRYPFFLYAYALMSNHIHLAIETREIPLSKIMQGIQQSYSHYVHKKYSYVGHLYQGPYGAVLYDKDEFALNLVRYIHRNPIEARLVENPVEYSWSSHRIYMNMENCSFLDKKFVLEMFPCDETKAIQMFNKFVLEGPQSLENFDFDDVRDRQVIGKKQFVERVKNRIENSSYDKKFDLNYDFTALTKKTLSEILKIVSKQTKVSADSILSPSRLRDITKARRMFAFISAKYGGYGTVEISKFLKKNTSSVSYMIHKLESELEFDPVLSEKLRKVIHIFEARPQS